MHTHSWIERVTMDGFSQGINRVVMNVVIITKLKHLPHLAKMQEHKQFINSLTRKHKHTQQNSSDQNKFHQQLKQN